MPVLFVSVLSVRRRPEGTAGEDGPTGSGTGAAVAGAKEEDEAGSEEVAGAGAASEGAGAAAVEGVVASKAEPDETESEVEVDGFDWASEDTAGAWLGCDVAAGDVSTAMAGAGCALASVLGVVPAGALDVGVEGTAFCVASTAFTTGCEVAGACEPVGTAASIPLVCTSAVFGAGSAVCGLGGVGARGVTCAFVGVSGIVREGTGADGALASAATAGCATGAVVGSMETALRVVQTGRRMQDTCAVHRILTIGGLRSRLRRN
jgi:hypothetical protein